MAKQKSRDRVAQVAAAAGLEIEILEMPASTRTADEAAEACGCALDQIVKSLIFAREDGALALFLIAGGNRLDPKRAEIAAGAPLSRADPAVVREVTGFAIGGVAPIGHLTDLPVYIDPRLMEFELVWAAAGAPNAVFSVAPGSLILATGALPY